MTCTRMFLRISTSAILFIAMGTQTVCGQTFTFTNITDMPAGPGSGMAPSINDNRDIAFQSGTDIYFYDESQNTFLNLMSLPGAPASARSPRLSLNGDIVMINAATRNLWLYEAGTQVFTNISTLAGYPGNTQSNDLGSVFDMNDNRQISFHSGDNNFGDIYLYDHNAGTFTEVTSQPGAAASGRSNKINNLGQVAYGSVGIIGAPVFVYEIATGVSTDISNLPGGPGSGLGALSFSDSGGVVMMLQAGADPVYYDASDSSFLHLATLAGFPAGNSSTSGNDLSADGDFTFWRTDIYHFDSDSQAFTQLTDVAGETPVGGRDSSINNNGVVAFTAGLLGIEDIFLAVPPIVGDINDDGVVNVFDLLDMLSAWGACDQPCPPSCAADITNTAGTGTDCEVDVFDLLLLLNNWSL